MTRLNKITIGFLVLITGIVHLYIVPDHFFHAPAHGIFFAFIGLLQIIWSATFLLKSKDNHFITGISLSGGVFVLWFLTLVVKVPFSNKSEGFDLSLVVSKICELSSFVLILPAFHRQKKQQLSINEQVIFGSYALLIGVVFLMGGLISEKLFPFLKKEDQKQTLVALGLAEEDKEHNHYGERTWGDVFRNIAFIGSKNKIANSNWTWNLPPGFPEPMVPAFNSMSPEKVKLGKFLFYDKKLSGNENFSCETCHQQNVAFTDEMRVPKGSTGEFHVRNSPSLTNAAYNATLTWANPVLKTLEEQIHLPMFGEHPIEMNITGNEEKVLLRFASDPVYEELFEQAFPADEDAINFPNIINSLSAFIRTFISGNSRFDQFVYQGNKDVLSPSELRGLNLFFSEDLECHHCHGGFNFTLSAIHSNTTFLEQPFHNTGLYNVNNKDAYPPQNPGLFEFTLKEMDRGKFRAPTLRNIALTAPYMHDGSVKTLDEVIRLYEQGGRNIKTGELKGDGRKNKHKSGFVGGFELTNQQRKDLVAFLEALTDSTFINDPLIANPFTVTKLAGN